MKTFLLLSAGLLLLSGSLAHAQTGMNLAWNNCITQGSAAEDKAYACDGASNGTPFKIVFSFFAPVALPQFVGIQATLDVQTSEASLPDWWRLGVGECREGNFSFPGSLSGIGTGTTGVCQNPWSGATTGGGMIWYSDGNGDTIVAGLGRAKLAFARTNERALVVDQQYVGGVITLDSFNDVDTENGVCTGCDLPACIVLQQVELFQTAGATNGDVHLITTAQYRNHITWQGGAIGGDGCPFGSQQLSNQMWGSIRAIYR
jgi:hypothetical protein